MGREERGVVARGVELGDVARRVVGDYAGAVEGVRGVLGPIEDALVRREVEGMGVGRLQEVTEGRVRVAGIEGSGVRTVGGVLEAGVYRLVQVPGVGRRTAEQLVAAARTVEAAVRESVAVRIDVERPEPGVTELVGALYVLVAAGSEARRAVDRAGVLLERLEPLLVDAGPVVRRFGMVVAGREGRQRAREAVAGIRALTEEAASLAELFAQSSVDLLRRPPSEAAAWVDFELRSAEYYGLLAEISRREPDEAAAEGFLPEEIAERVRVQRLDDTHRRVSLRGYQEFGARFALARRKVILGDEMGLGKTIQAIAVLAHLAAEGHRRFLVVCPASVLVNWTREVEARSALPVRVLHGPARHDAFADWRGRGGVGVTTFEALRGFPVPGPDEVGLLVVDEAHAVKNPEAKRSRAVARWTERCERALFLTGTPMENRIAEFRSLVGMLDGEVAEALRDRDAHAFRRIAAPVYLRRNQRDVLTELPLLQHTDEWEELSASDEEAYRDAVRAGNFMAMRRAAYARPERSAKLNRLREIVREAAQTGQKTVVFSHFRDVLAVAGAALAADVPVYGPLDGATPAVRRQLVVDDFGGAAGPAVLLAQIQAAGVGLNVQAASVVVLCEPQTTPALEHQAVARAHRMGQVRPVRVHRLLATGGVDERLLQLLAHKARLFDTYARRSAVAEATPDAVDVSDTGLARRVVEEEQLRLGLTGG
ncbi:DEAD/DEAH box helicase [Streptomyces niveiscabiei]|uniref:DEAD/DEAH box helicase n=1 Tax=Streptomyces niveiscabiei TaxID=164115 RepID=UPI003EB86605